MVVVRIEAEDGGLLADMNIQVTVDIVDESFGACGDITTIGSAIAGSFSGLFGGIFSLASLACD